MKIHVKNPWNTLYILIWTIWLKFYCAIVFITLLTWIRRFFLFKHPSNHISLTHTHTCTPKYFREHTHRHYNIGSFYIFYALFYYTKVVKYALNLLSIRNHKYIFLLLPVFVFVRFVCLCHFCVCVCENTLQSTRIP